MISLLASKWIAINVYGIQVIDAPTDSTAHWLVNTVAELTQKAGIPMPAVGIYESDETNAFATGPSRGSALVAVSSGLLQRMNEREIRGVLAHEIGHITNGDMVTMTLLQGILNSFVILLSYVVGIALDSFLRGDRDERYRGPGLGSWVGRMIAQVVFGFLASMVVAAYSRSREFAADRMSAQLNGKPSMIAALQKLQNLYESHDVLDDRSPALSAFKISNRSGTGLTRLFATHPPLEERIAALERA
jgi:heat shock protein HtpX